MSRVIFFFGALFLLLGAVFYIFSLSGTWVFNFSGIEITMPTHIGVILILFCALTIICFAFLMRWLWRLPSTIGEAQKIKRVRRGEDFLTRGLMAFLDGRTNYALPLLQQAQKNLPDQPFVGLVWAQAIDQTGDIEKAENRFRALAGAMDQPQKRLAGLQGLYYLFLRRGAEAQAMEQVRMALFYEPNASWALEASFEFSVRAGKWEEARRLLVTLKRHKIIAKSDFIMRQNIVEIAAITYRLTQDTPAPKDEVNGFIKTMRHGLRHSPDFVPAISLLARLYEQAGRVQEADKLLIRAWKKQPHPDLARAWDYCHRDINIAQQLAALPALIGKAPQHIESHILHSQLAIKAERWDLAQKILHQFGDLQIKSSARLCYLMCDLEIGRAYGDKEKARQWLRFAADAPPEFGWYSGDRRLQGWSPICPFTGQFNRVEWRQPKMPKQEDFPRAFLMNEDQHSQKILDIN